MVKTFDLKNKTIIISGGYGYLGTAITESLLFHGARVYVLGKNSEKFKMAFKKLDKSRHANLHFKECDFAKNADIISSFKFIAEEEGRIDVLINNAFYSKGQSPEAMTDIEWEYGIEGTLSTVFRGIREIIPYFKANGEGKIINVSSMYGLVAPDFDVY